MPVLVLTTVGADAALLSPAREYARRRASSLVDALAPRFAEIRRGTIERRAGGEGQPSAAALGHAFLPSELEHANRGRGAGELVVN